MVKGRLRRRNGCESISFPAQVPVIARVLYAGGEGGKARRSAERTSSHKERRRAAPRRERRLKVMALLHLAFLLSNRVP